MSLLLDALKKSEAQRRRGAGPAIDLASMPSRTADRGRERRRWPLLVAAAALLVLVGVAVWPWVPGLVERFGRAERPDTVADPSSAIDAAQRSGAAGAAESDEANAPPSQKPIEQPAVVGAQRPARGVETKTPPVTSDVAGASDPVRPDGTASDGAAVSAPSQEPAVSAEPQAQTRVADRSGPAASARPLAESAVTGGEPAVQDVESAPSPEVEAEAVAERESAPDFIRPWELPQARRAEFPELDMTVHFYAEEPSRRFVLINGERYSEGQRIGSGVRLLEIVQRGAIVDFENYRVLIE